MGNDGCGIKRDKAGFLRRADDVDVVATGEARHAVPRCSTARGEAHATPTAAGRIEKL